MDSNLEVKDHPNMHELFNGNLASRRTLLQQWLCSGEDPSKCECGLVLTRENTEEAESEEQLLTIIGMRRAGVSENLGICFPHSAFCWFN